ncbi:MULTISPECIES: 30S ribosomal protein S1 [unclassified Paracoccus (in: a-proteobacteria)]|uniref:30S ribosomal protein S1 n=1 Tax=unclassified Paracoccus (in: a-proteobacteria) TaxID=2688777 RepID=UPI001602FEFB|nr:MULTISPECIES: 30S ribosomal protein S1 [unclassified Paracoccus (in: a-proteobacteria)]MBB1490856.1 30S ribosomal protein S1 [Paracoccus sp. MC1854]MBB1497800.1 30S ribosomal protein S1 [Paracoccus sp. MC1862]QQO45283.1 30S ribosomal protein S1 [Paracoccus sp. MC1862]
MAKQTSMEEFEALLNESFEIDTPDEGSVVKGRVLAIEAGQAIIDVGYKMEGRVDLKEFANPGEEPNLKVGDEVEVYLDRVENARGEASISREKARREEAWDRLEQAYAKEERVEGAIFGRVKGGFTVDLGGAVAFLPGSQVDVRPVRDAGPLMGLKQPFQILKMDRRRGNIVVSRRAILEESRAEQRAEVISNLHEGQVVDGVVKNITEYGAFVDLGGVDGLLHVTDMAWRRVNHPSEILSIGETVKVQVVKINKETHRISLGMKQLQSDPWDTVSDKFPLGSVHKGRVTNITDYGAFVELEAGVEGLVHVSEMSWTKKNVHPGKIVSTSQEVDVMVLEIDEQKRRVSLGLKQTMRNPWEVFAETHPAGTPIEGEVKNITEFGLFVGLEGDIDGMVHLSDISWDQRGEDAIQNYRKGDTVQAVVQEVDIDKERISLSIKAMENDTMSEAVDGVKRGDVVTAEVTAIEDGGIEVEYNGVKSFIRRSDLARDRQDQRPERFSVGDKVDVRVTNIDTKTRRLGLSIKAREIAEEKEAIDQYGSSDSGASLGDILGAALKNRG